MRIVEIIELENGSHNNQNGSLSVLPNGWAVIPDDVETSNFPFGEILVEDINGVKTVTEWIPGTIPETPETEPEITEIEQLRADIDYIAVMTGVEL